MDVELEKLKEIPHYVKSNDINSIDDCKNAVDILHKIDEIIKLMDKYIKEYESIKSNPKYHHIYSMRPEMKDHDTFKKLKSNTEICQKIRLNICKRMDLFLSSGFKSRKYYVNIIDDSIDIWLKFLDKDLLKLDDKAFKQFRSSSHSKLKQILKNVNMDADLTRFLRYLVSKRDLKLPKFVSFSQFSANTVSILFIQDLLIDKFQDNEHYLNLEDLQKIYKLKIENYNKSIKDWEIGVNNRITNRFDVQRKFTPILKFEQDLIRKLTTT